jgi:tryptophan synthase beta subunit
MKSWILILLFLSSTLFAKNQFILINENIISQKEGLIPALESAHGVAYLKKLDKEEIKDKIIIVNLSGRGDKDMIQAMEILKDRI